MQTSFHPTVVRSAFSPPKAMALRTPYSPIRTFQPPVTPTIKFGAGAGMALGFLMAGLIQLATLPVTIPLRLMKARTDALALSQAYATLNSQDEKVNFLKSCLDLHGANKGGGPVKWAVTQLSGIQDETIRAELILMGLVSLDQANYIGQGAVIETLMTEAKSLKDSTLSKQAMKVVDAKKALLSARGKEELKARYHFEYMEETLKTQIQCDRGFKPLTTEPERFAYILKQMEAQGPATTRWACEQINTINNDTLAAELILSGILSRGSVYYPDERAEVVYNVLKSSIDALEDVALKTKLSGLFSQIENYKHVPHDYAKPSDFQVALVELSTAREYPALATDTDRYEYLKAKAGKGSSIPEQEWAVKQMAVFQDDNQKAELVLLALKEAEISRTAPRFKDQKQHFLNIIAAANTIQNPELGPKVVQLAEAKSKLNSSSRDSEYIENDDAIQKLLETLTPQS